jgi:hypothetical protein
MYWTRRLCRGGKPLRPRKGNGIGEPRMTAADFHHCATAAARRQRKARQAAGSEMRYEPEVMAEGIGGVLTTFDADSRSSNVTRAR